MNSIMQNIVVLTLVASCVLFVGQQAFSALLGRKSKLGSCCDKGCGTEAEKTASNGSKTQKIVFLPVEMLGRKRP